MNNYAVTVFTDGPSQMVEIQAHDYEIFYDDEGSGRTLLQFTNTEQDLVSELSIASNHSFVVINR